MRVTVREILSDEDIRKRVETIGRAISEDYRYSSLVVVSVLKGAFIFTADLVRHITCNLEVDFVETSSYGSQTETSGEVVLVKDIETDVRNRDVLIVEDIVDTGLTVSFLKKHITENYKPKTLKVACLISKKERRKAPVKLDYVCFEIASGFVVGYGMDYDSYYRNLSCVKEIEEWTA